MNPATNTLIIEVRGGIVQDVYTDANSLRVVLVEWDEKDDEEHRASGGDFPVQPIGNLPKKTMSAVLSLVA